MNKSPNEPERHRPKHNGYIKNIFISFWGIWVILAVLLIFFAIKTGYTPRPEEEREVVETTITPAFGEREYVGSKRCKDCHWREYDTWKYTLHSKFVQFPGEYTIIGDFEMNNKMTVKVTNKAPKFASKEVTTKMYKKGGKFYVNTIGPDWEAHDYEVAYVLGINRKQNYITRFPNGAMHVLPLEWDAINKIWVDFNGLKGSYPGKGNYWSDTESIWQLKCGGCHVTGLKTNYDKDSDSFDSNWTDLGIGCEACHGPAGKHVFSQSKVDIIVDKSAEQCGSCHYRDAGHRIAASSGYIKHHEQYDEMIGAGHKGLECVTCHDPHEPRAGMPPKVPHTLKGRTDCQICHNPQKHEPWSAPPPQIPHTLKGRTDCLSCHGPQKLRGATLPKIPHTLKGRADCLSCHNSGGIKPFPKDHIGRTAATCLNCHRTG